MAMTAVMAIAITAINPKRAQTGTALTESFRVRRLNP